MLSADHAMHALLAPPSAATHARSEGELRAVIVEALRLSGIAVEQQVVCGAGMADLVTTRRDAVLEVKLDLSRKNLYTAIGQVLLYRAAINPLACAIVVGYATEETAGLIDWAAELGVEVVGWRLGVGACQPARSQLPIPNPPVERPIARAIPRHHSRRRPGPPAWAAATRIVWRLAGGGGERQRGATRAARQAAGTR